MQQCIFDDILRKMSARAATPQPFCLLRAGMENIPARSERAGRLCRISSVISSITAKRARPVGRALCLRFAKEPFLQVLLVALDHLLDHLAADGTGLARGEIAVVALLEVDANLPWCTPVILKCPFTHTLRYDEGKGAMRIAM